MIKEISPQVFAIVHNGHTLRQHYFTQDSARAVLRTLK